MDKSVHDKLCGELIVDFANAKTSDEAGLKFIANIQKIFDFSPQFTAEAQNKFPKLSNFKSSFNTQEWEILELFTEIISLLVQDATHFPNIGLDGYDFYFPDEKLLVFIVYSLYFPDGEVREIEIEQSGKKYIEELKNLFDEAVDDKVSIEEKPKMFDEFLKYIEKYLALGDKVWDLKKHFDETSFFEIRKQAGYYFGNLLKEHDHINIVIEQLKSCLEFIIDRSCADKKSGLESLNNFASLYNNIKRPNLYITPDGDIVRDHLYKEDFFIERNQSIVYELDKYYDNIIAYSLFKYLAGSGNKPKKCSFCEKFFIATKNNPRQKFCSVCSRKNKMTHEERASYMKGYRANPARIKSIAKKKREEMIQHLVTNAGKTRKEAEIIADDEV